MKQVKNGKAKFCIGVFVILGGILLRKTTDAEELQEKGARIFQDYCTACHTIGGGKLVGPDLQGVTERRTLEWLRGFIQSPSSYLEKQDEIATALFQEYGIAMPDLGLSAEDVEAVLAFLGGGSKPVERGIPVMFYWTLGFSVLGLLFFTYAGIMPARKKLEV
ncbi:MAG: c-type cytochrome [bacterium]